jgi:hypothetical protein
MNSISSRSTGLQHIFWASSYALITVGTGAILDKLPKYVKNQEKPNHLRFAFPHLNQRFFPGDCAQLFRSKPALRVNQSSALKWAKTIIQSALADFRC